MNEQPPDVGRKIRRFREEGPAMVAWMDSLAGGGEIRRKSELGMVEFNRDSRRFGEGRRIEEVVRIQEVWVRGRRFVLGVSDGKIPRREEMFETTSGLGKGCDGSRESGIRREGVSGGEYGRSGREGADFWVRCRAGVEWVVGSGGDGGEMVVSEVRDGGTMNLSSGGGCGGGLNP